MKSIGICIALVLLAVFAFLAGWASKIVVTGVTAATLVQSVTVLVTVILAVWTYRATKRKEAEARLFGQKASVYEPLVEELKKAHLAGKNGNPETDEKKLAQALVDIQFKAIIWGDQAFLRALIEFGEAEPGELPDQTFGRMAKLYEQMRRELGHADKPGVGYDVMELLLIADDRHLIRTMKAKIYGKA